MDSRRSSGLNGPISDGGRHDALYRRGSNISDASFMSDVEMAQDDIFSGPISESVPSANTGFFHRTRSRAGSTTSFTYYEEGRDSDSYPSDSYPEEDAIVEDGAPHSQQDQDGQLTSEIDLEAGNTFYTRDRSSSTFSKSSRYSRDARRSQGSVDDPLLRTHDSNRSTSTNISVRAGKDRVSQKIYIQSEDLTIVIAGFRTSPTGFLIYLTLCAVTAGLAYLLLRWLPRWRMWLIGAATVLRECDWVVIEVCTAPSTFFSRLTILESMGRNKKSAYQDPRIWTVSLHRLWVL